MGARPLDTPESTRDRRQAAAAARPSERRPHAPYGMAPGASSALAARRPTPQKGEAGFPAWSRGTAASPGRRTRASGLTTGWRPTLASLEATPLETTEPDPAPERSSRRPGTARVHAPDVATRPAARFDSTRRRCAEPPRADRRGETGRSGTPRRSVEGSPDDLDTHGQLRREPHAAPVLLREARGH